MDSSNLKFNIGLPLSSNVKKFRKFLEKFHQNIDSVFFSLPLGMSHQTRSRVHRFFCKEKNVAAFWKMLQLVKEFGISLELLLNAYTLVPEDVKKSSVLLAEHNIEVDAVCPLEHLYEETLRHFPNKKIIYSYNNGIRSIADFDKANQKYNCDYYVIASSCIRNNELFRHIHQSGKKVILLLNNGCSYNCNWCKDNGSCMKTFQQNRKKHSVEYLYALQSILPNELFDGTIDLSSIDLLKFSNRTSSIDYTKKGLDSYISGNMLKYVRNRRNYSLYARMQGFWRYFLFLRLRKIKEYKEEILGHSVIFK